MFRHRICVDMRGTDPIDTPHVSAGRRTRPNECGAILSHVFTPMNTDCGVQQTATICENQCSSVAKQLPLAQPRRRLEIGVQNGPTSGVGSALKMDPPYLTLEVTGAFVSGFGSGNAHGGRLRTHSASSS